MEEEKQKITVKKGGYQLPTERHFGLYGEGYLLNDGFSKVAKQFFNKLHNLEIKEEPTEQEIKARQSAIEAATATNPENMDELMRRAKIIYNYILNGGEI